VPRPQQFGEVGGVIVGEVMAFGQDEVCVDQAAPPVAEDPVGLGLAGGVPDLGGGCAAAQHTVEIARG